jgi:hypothetical protein
MDRKKRYRCLTARLLANSHFNKRGCLLWDGAKSKDSYGRISFWTKNGTRKKSAHSVAFKLWGGKFPRSKKLEYSHQCGNANCISPTHCLWETHAQNCAKKGEYEDVPF